MFQDAAEYNSANFTQRRRAVETLQKYHGYMKYSGEDLILEVGSGSGNVTREIFVPSIPHSNFRLVAVDKLKHMVEFANETNKDPRLVFRVLDITEENEDIMKSVFTEEELHLGFNLVFSFHCLHWTQNYLQSYKNIFSLMRPGGQMLSTNVAYTTFGEIWKDVHKTEKWRPYLKDVPVFTFPYHDSNDPGKDLTKLLEETGFQDIYCFSERTFYISENNSDPVLPMRKLMENFDPYLHLIPKCKSFEYMDDVMDVYNKWIQKQPGLPYDRLVVIATKPLK